MNLRGLIEAVERGAEPGLYYRVPKSLEEHAETICAAHYGSLDAAKRLHDALASDWTAVELRSSQQRTWWIADLSRLVNGEEIYSTGRDENPARAWLLAILRALDDQREGGRE